MNFTGRVLHVFCGPFPTPQGTQTLVKQTCILLAKKNVNTHLLCYSHQAPEPTILPFTVHRIPDMPPFRSERSGPAIEKIPLDMSVAVHVRRLLNRLRPQIVHAHHYEALIACRLADPSRHVPLVFHQHATFAPELPTYGPSFLKMPLRALGTAMDRGLPRLANHTFAISQFNFQQLHQYLAPDRFSLLYPPAADLPPRCSPRNHRSKPDSRVTAVYTGNLDNYQNVEALLAAIAALPGSIQQQFRLQLITASDTASLIPHIHKSPGCIEVIRHNSFETVWSQMCSADFAIVPRAAAGGVPIKMINALAAEIPVIINPNVFSDLSASEALLVDTASPKKLASAIEQLVVSPALRDKLARNSRKVIRKLFHPDSYVSHILGTYVSLNLLNSCK
ncbi:MAG: glycosyltransferase family 4 protein [Deltaproteobacteria bacterium]|nr:glycosyltransferase family 4 protein [Deltaproteobacteria bacterium]MBN2673727.1 glycosyltransferase family 4 protein [Deltaproteobacteria bacterium]